MLKKVMKYELRASGRQLLPLFALGLVLSSVLRLLYHLAGFIWTPAQNVMEALCLLGSSLGAFAVIAVTFVAVVVRFYQSMVGGEAYLTFALPVKASTQIWGRAWVALLYTTFACVVGVAMAFIGIPGALTLLRAEFSNITIHTGAIGASRAVALNGGQATLIFGAVILFMVFCLLVMLYQIYASIALGTVLTQNRVLGGILGYMILNTVESVLALPAIVVPMALSIGFNERQWMAYFDSWMNGSDAEVINKTILFLFTVLGIAFLVNLVFTVAHYIITKRYFTTRLNLE